MAATTTTATGAEGKLTKEQVANLQYADVHKTISRVMLADGFHLVVDFSKSEGCWLYDGISGKKYLDFFSYFASWATGHNHPKMICPEFKKIMANVAVENPSNSDVYSLEMAKFVATFERVAMPAEFKHVFFVAGGGLAVENALKCAFDWKVRKNMAAGKGEKGQKVIHFNHCFHGRTGYTLSLTATDPIKTMYFPKFADWPRIEPPACKFPLEGDNLRATEEAERKAIAQITDVLERDADDVAAIILETIQGEGGDSQFRREFLQELRRLADKYSVFLIFDEVQCGMGITGKFWAWQNYGVAPDALCFGKKSQVCGFMTTARVDEVPDNVFHCCSRINSTWGGNLTDMVRAQRILEIIEEDQLVEHAATTGKYLIKVLLEVQARFPQLISNTRGVGLLCAFDLPDGESRNRLRQICQENGMMILACGPRSIRFRPALVTNNEECDIAVKIICGALETMSKK